MTKSKVIEQLENLKDYYEVKSKEEDDLSEIIKALKIAIAILKRVIILK